MQILVLLCQFRFDRLYKAVGINRFVAIKARAMSLPSGLSGICFRETYKAVPSIREQQFGKQHPDTLATLKSYVSLLREAHREDDIVALEARFSQSTESGSGTNS